MAYTALNVTPLRFALFRKERIVVEVMSSVMRGML